MICLQNSLPHFHDEDCGCSPCLHAALDRILLISALWSVGATACHCSPTSEATKHACPTPEWGHAGLCQQLLAPATPGRRWHMCVTCRRRHGPASHLTPQAPWGRSGFGGLTRGSLSTVWDADPTEMTVGPFINCERFVTEARQSCVGLPRTPVLLWVSTSETRRKSSEVSPMFINTIWCKLSSKLFKITSRLRCLPRSAQMPSPQSRCSSVAWSSRTQLRPLCGAVPAPLLSSSCRPGCGERHGLGRCRGSTCGTTRSLEPEHPSGLPEPRPPQSNPADRAELRAGAERASASPLCPP